MQFHDNTPGRLYFSIVIANATTAADPPLARTPCSQSFLIAFISFYRCFLHVSTLLFSEEKHDTLPKTLGPDVALVRA